MFCQVYENNKRHKRYQELHLCICRYFCWLGVSTSTMRQCDLHLCEADRMYLNPSLIVFVEPVGTNSLVAQKIAQEK